MVVTVKKDGPTGRRIGWRLLLWAMMASAVFWTLLYRAAERGADVPEFMYAQF